MRIFNIFCKKIFDKSLTNNGKMGILLDESKRTA